MKKGTSLYLDLVRFSAALMVFLEHFREHTKHGFGFFWKLHPFWYSHSNPFSQTAVIVFFVLSGYVIAHVMATREGTPLEYAASRFARLYSVVVPAVLLTAACNYLIALRYPHAFEGFQSQGAVGVGLCYLGNLFFVNEFWLWPPLDLPNAPFWTMPFEASYYLAIGLCIFASGRARILGLVLLALLAGPTIVLLAPTWLLGYGAYYLSHRRQLRCDAAAALWLGTALLLLLCPEIELRFRAPLEFLRMPDRSLGELLASYAAAVCFATNFFAFNALSDRVVPFFRAFSGSIRWLGSLTFALYLFHQPLLSLFTVYGVPDRSSADQAILMIGGTFLVVTTLGRFCERTKGVYKRLFLLLWERAATRVAVIG
jgi:peptidoglycan/LPS O-acetylase OafA/YrhL